MQKDATRKGGWKWALKVTAIVIFLLGVLVYVKRDTVFQEGNPLPFVPAMLTVTFTSCSICTVQGNPRVLLGKSWDDAALHRYMAERGWVNTPEMLGSSFLYKCGENRLYVQYRVFWRFFCVYWLNRAP